MALKHACCGCGGGWVGGVGLLEWVGGVGAATRWSRWVGFNSAHTKHKHWNRWDKDYSFQMPTPASATMPAGFLMRLVSHVLVMPRPACFIWPGTVPLHPLPQIPYGGDPREETSGLERVKHTANRAMHFPRLEQSTLMANISGTVQAAIGYARGEQENMHIHIPKRTIKIGNWRIVPATLSSNSSLLDKLGIRKFTCWNMDMCSLELCAKIMKNWLHVLSQPLKHIITVSTASEMQWSAISGNLLLSLLAVGIHTKSIVMN